MAEGRMDSAEASCDCARHARRLHVGARTMAVCLLVVLSGRVCTSLNKGSTVATDAALVSNRTVVLPSSGREGGGYRNVTAILDRLLSTYDPQLRPGFGRSALIVKIDINIRSMGPISELDMAYSMDCYFRQRWQDKRLAFENLPGAENLADLPVAIRMLDRIWKPDTYFYNGKKSYIHTVTTPNKFFRISRDGSLLYSMRLTIKASCPMHLETFPMDTQMCPLRLGSFGYTSDDVVYMWTRGVHDSIKTSKDMLLSQFDLVSTPASNETLLIKTGKFSMLLATFKLRRHMGYFLIQVYVPCGLIVILSWVGFWINREATADRVALGITSVLTMSFLGLENRSDLPKVAYSTALDWFVHMCFGFVFATILQFATVHYFTKYGTGDEFQEYLSDCEEEDTSGNEAAQNQVNGDTKGVNAELVRKTIRRLRRPIHDDPCWRKVWNCISGTQRYNISMRTGNALTRQMSVRCMGGRLERTGRANSVSRIDKAARILFPAIFSTLNMIYWLLYMNLRSRASATDMML